MARCLMRLERSDSGRIEIDGTDVVSQSGRALRPFRRRVQMIFQDPFESLNPRFRVGGIITQGPIRFGMPRHEALARAEQLLELVGLDPAALRRFPHEFSGGQRQRIGIARALAMEPEIIIADEPVSALDVSVQAQILELLRDLRQGLDLTMVFITHDLRVAAEVCDRVAVMRNGEIVEMERTEKLFAAPRHAYTRELLDSVPGRRWSTERATTHDKTQKEVTP
jgi:peptide/nickel transport system ATP-binding protein